MNKRRAVAVLFLFFITAAWLPCGNAAPLQNPAPRSLEFDAGAYTVKTLTVNGHAVSYRCFENIIYVAFPVDIQYECMNVYVPEAYYADQSIGGYRAETAPIFFPNTVGGYMPGAPAVPGKGWTNGPDAVSVALSKGYVVAAPGARGRTGRDETGRYTGKAPACIVDLKAAVRYLRHNDAVMPGDAEKIISNGTSAGGALSALMGATGNSRDYEPYLKALGAADGRDDIFAASCYCPITNLDHADMAYEWQFGGVNDYQKTVFTGMTAAGPQREEIKGALTPQQIRISAGLKKGFPAYVNGLGLKSPEGGSLTLDRAGNGPFKEYVKSFVMASAQRAMDEGQDLSALTWITFQDGKVTDIDFEKYVRYATRMKTPPAFDGVDLSNGENELFGTETVNARHFTRFGLENSIAGGTIAEADLVIRMNPMNYIGREGVTTAGHWRVRHGTADRDTSLAVPVILSTRLKNMGYDVDFALPWGIPHSGDYDLDALFAWMDRICR